jgi:hypothetical protein
VDSAGNVYVLATAGSDYLIRKYDTNGVLLWSQQYNGGGTETAVDLALDSAGNVIVTGTSNNDYLTLKYNANGVLLWFRQYNSGGTETAVDLALDSAGNVIVTGTSNNDYLTLKYNANGDPVVGAAIQCWNGSRYRCYSRQCGECVCDRRKQRIVRDSELPAERKPALGENLQRWLVSVPPCCRCS